LKDAEVLNVIAFAEIVKQVSFVIAVCSLMHGLIVCLSDVEEPISLRM